MRPVTLPAGLESKDLEIYIHKGHLHVLYNSLVIHFEQLPEEIKDLFAQHMMANKAAISSLKNDFGLTDASEMLIQYLKCNFGNFDMIPDMDEEGTIYPVCWDCGKRGECPGEGKICSRIVGPNGILEKAETEIYFMLIAGMSHKMIADKRGKHIQTIEGQLRDMRAKLGSHSSIEVMGFALKRKHI
jgi:DNA-binding CsgD family transcriptional regulator